MKDLLIMEVEGYLGNELSLLEKELAAKEEGYRKAVEDLRKLPLVSRLERPLKPFLRWFLPRKVKKLRREMADLREKISQYRQAETELKEGNYGLASILLGKLADRFCYPAMPSLGFDSLAGGGSTGICANPMFFHLIDLKEKLEDRMRGEIIVQRSPL